MSESLNQGAKLLEVMQTSSTSSSVQKKVSLEIQAYQKLDYTISIFQIYKHNSKGIKMAKIKCACEKRAHVLPFLSVLRHGVTGAALSAGQPAAGMSPSQWLSRRHARPAPLASYLPFKACVCLTSIPPRRKKNISLWQARESSLS